VTPDLRRLASRSHDSLWLSMAVVSTLIEEMILRAQGYRLIAGVDEAGRGPLAGPVVAAAVILPLDSPALWLHMMRDSKQLAPAVRVRLYCKVVEHAVASATGVVSSAEVDSLGIGEASRLAMRLAVERLKPAPDFLLVDGYGLPSLTLPNKGVIKGDELCISIAAASILAKVTRDRLMIELDQQYPGYGFAQHKGYGTATHIQCLRELGPCAIHRRSFAPVAAMLHDQAR